MFNEVIAINKDAGFTSHDVVTRLRSLLMQKRIGHAGTLDPFATGVLVIGLGQATKLLEYFSAEKKTYVATFVFGEERTTDDVEGEAVSSAFSFESPVGASPFALTDKQFKDVLKSLADDAFAQAEIAKLKEMKTQIPPAFSAVSVEGVRSYKAARKQEKNEVEQTLSPRSIEIYSAELLEIGVMNVKPQDYEEESEAPLSKTTDKEISQDAPKHKELPFWTLKLDVSKGTYIRSIARDLGRALGVGGYVHALKRVASGALSLQDCLSLEEIEQAKTEDAEKVEARSAEQVEARSTEKPEAYSAQITERNAAEKNVGKEAVNSLPAANDEGLLEKLLDAKAINLYEVLDIPFRYLSPFEFKKVQTGCSIMNRDAVYRDQNILPKRGDRVALFNEEGIWGIWQVKDDISLVCEKNFTEPIKGLEVPYVL